ncbi:MAG TPA: TGS domain-containing protein, partial [Bacteroidales bacterium]|nr:TGS domain-containing protein [Bacteroidales bacterium]
LIKLADRLHNMRTLDSMPPEKQLKIASETTYLFAPLAHRLGLYNIKTELEDLALKYTEPEVYNTIVEKLKETEQERKRFINKFTFPIKQVLTERGIPHVIISRTKAIASIWNKMKVKAIPFEEVYDLFAVRIIVDSPIETEKEDCLRVYGIVTNLYSPKPDRIRDWISNPKANGYEALHTTVMSNVGKWVEVQIRSRRMDEIAEKGYAAHWKYKGNFGNTENSLDEWLNKIKELLKNPNSNALDFIEDFKANLFADEIFVFTPKGESKKLPLGSTVIDFAYAIHSEIGNKCIGAKVNYKLVPLNHVLSSGDQIEIITSAKQYPREEWIEYANTARAKLQIKEAIKEQKKKISEEGRLLLDSFLKQMKIENSYSNIDKLKNFYNLPNVKELFYQVGSGKLNIKDIKACFHKEEKTSLLKILSKQFIKTTTHNNIINNNIVERQLPDNIIEQIKLRANKLKINIPENANIVKYSFQGCCYPIPGDEVIAMLAPDNKNILIHRTGCNEAINLMAKYGDRIIKARWNSSESISFLSGIKISGIDKMGLINEITKIISKELNVNIKSFNIESNNGTFEGQIMLYILNTEHLNNLIKQIKRVNGIQKVIRIE